MNRNPQAGSLDAGPYNTATPVSWARSSWQVDPPGGRMGPNWPELIASFRTKARIGEEAPDFTAERLDGGAFTLSALRGQKSVLIVFGCYACPPCVTNISTSHPNLVSLYAQYAAQGFEFVYVYTREAHPGPNIAPHRSMEDKRKSAERLRKTEGVTFPIVVDTYEGDVHHLYADVRFNNPVFLVNKAGFIVYKAAWLDSFELPQVLDEVVLWDRMGGADKVLKKGYSERIRLMHEQFEPECMKRTEKLMFDEVGISRRELGPIPGDASR